MRPLVIAALVSVVSVTGLSSCGKDEGGADAGPCQPGSLLPGAQLCPDRTAVGFGREFGRPVYLGTSQQETFLLTNGGLADLHVTTATLSGSGAFRLDVAYDLDGGFGAGLPATVAGGKHAYLRVLFTPTQPQLYTGQIAVGSDAENTPSATLSLSGCGLPGPGDGGRSPCYYDGGVPP